MTNPPAMPERFTKKPVTIEAFQMTEARRMDNRDWPEWLNEAWNKAEGQPGALFRQNMDAPLPDLLCIQTLEGIHLVNWGDWIIRGVKGELYPCKPDIFEMTYERAALQSAQPAEMSDDAVNALVAQAIFFKEGATTVRQLRLEIQAILPQRPAAQAAQGVPEGPTQEAMTSKWCWWLGDGERFQIVETESEAHGEAQCSIDDDCDPGQTHQYSIARVQHPIDALGMGWLAEHVAESIAENACCWCDDNTGAEEPSIMLSADDKKALGIMVAGFLRQRVGVDWWTADQKTVRLHTYVSGSNDGAPGATAAQQGAEHG